MGYFYAVALLVHWDYGFNVNDICFFLVPVPTTPHKDASGVTVQPDSTKHFFYSGTNPLKSRKL